MHIFVSVFFAAQVFPLGWTAVYVSLDNVGVWNLRTENLDRWYLGQETYMRIINPEDSNNKTELPVPDNALYCGALSRMQKYSTLKAAARLFSPPSCCRFSSWYLLNFPGYFCRPQKITSSSAQLVCSKLLAVLLVIFSTLVSGLR